MEINLEHSVFRIIMQANSFLTRGSPMVSETGCTKPKFFKTCSSGLGGDFVLSVTLPYPTYLESFSICYCISLNTFEVSPAWILCHILTIIILIARPAVCIFLDVYVGHRIHHELKFRFLAFERRSAPLPAVWDCSVCEVCGFFSLYMYFIGTDTM